MKIILSGGGTLGPVVPLLAVYEIYKKKHPDTEFIWVGTKKGPERELVEKYGVPFFAIGAAKWRRYFSLWNIVDIFRFIGAFFEALFFLKREKPDLLIAAGGFVGVPVHLAGAVLGIKAWVHQQDFRPGLANKIIAPFAKKITVALKSNLINFPAEKTEWLGNPVRDLTVGDVSASKSKFGLPPGAPVIFALGGGTGSALVNQLVTEALPQWPADWQVIHLVGKDRDKETASRVAGVFSNYHAYVFFADEMKDAYAAADVVVARAGFATITEAAALGKAVILLPMAGTHQEENAKFLAKENAAVVLDERVVNGATIAQVVKDLMEKKEERATLGRRLREVLPPADPEKIIRIIEELGKL